MVIEPKDRWDVYQRIKCQTRKIDSLTAKLSVPNISDTLLSEYAEETQILCADTFNQLNKVVQGVEINRLKSVFPIGYVKVPGTFIQLLQNLKVLLLPIAREVSFDNFDLNSIKKLINTRIYWVRKHVASVTISVVLTGIFTFMRIFSEELRLLLRQLLQ